MNQQAGDVFGTTKSLLEVLYSQDGALPQILHTQRTVEEREYLFVLRKLPRYMLSISVFGLFAFLFKIFFSYYYYYSCGELQFFKLYPYFKPYIGVDNQVYNTCAKVGIKSGKVNNFLLSTGYPLTYPHIF